MERRAEGTHINLCVFVRSADKQHVVDEALELTQVFNSMPHHEDPCGTDTRVEKKCIYIGASWRAI